MSSPDILPAARIEYDEAFKWYLGKSVRAAGRFVSEVESAIEQIRRNPDQFARWDDTYRYIRLERFPYFVAYRQHGDLVVIVAIRHAAQDQDAWIGH